MHITSTWFSVGGLQHKSSLDGYHITLPASNSHVHSNACQAGQGRCHRHAVLPLPNLPDLQTQTSLGGHNKLLTTTRCHMGPILWLYRALQPPQTINLVSTKSRIEKWQGLCCSFGAIRGLQGAAQGPWLNAWRPLVCTLCTLEKASRVQVKMQ